jgi:isopentenyl-diphosphate delta-isomerase
MEIMVAPIPVPREQPGPVSAEPIMIPGIDADGRLFPIEKLEAHRRAVFHLAISAFVFDGDALLIQRRALGKYHCGGLWANTCCTHPNWGETLDAAARRRVREELGFAVPLNVSRVVEYSADVGNYLHEHERVTMFVGQADRRTLAIIPNPDEVAETRWVTGAELRREIEAEPSRFTPWFRIYVERYPDLRF